MLQFKKWNFDPVRVITAGQAVKPFSLDWSVIRTALRIIFWVYSFWFLSNLFIFFLAPAQIWPPYNFLSGLMAESAVVYLIAWLILLAGPVLMILEIWTGHFYSRIFLASVVLTAGLHFRIMVMERVLVSGPSMEPTITANSHIWIGRWKPIPTLPPLSFPFRIPVQMAKMPRFTANLNLDYNDIVAIHYPMTTGMPSYWIKRVVALPGDSFEFKEGELFVNGTITASRYSKGRTRLARAESGAIRNIQSEALADMSTEVLLSATSGIPGKGIVPEGAVIVLGDNRENSLDSRHFGFIPIRFIQGVRLQLWKRQRTD